MSGLLTFHIQIGDDFQSAVDVSRGPMWDTSHVIRIHDPVGGRGTVQPEGVDISWLASLVHKTKSDLSRNLHAGAPTNWQKIKTADLAGGVA